MATGASALVSNMALERRAACARLGNLTLAYYLAPFNWLVYSTVKRHCWQARLVSAFCEEV